MSKVFKTTLDNERTLLQILTRIKRKHTFQMVIKNRLKKSKILKRKRSKEFLKVKYLLNLLHQKNISLCLTIHIKKRDL